MSLGVVLRFISATFLFKVAGELRQCRVGETSDILNLCLVD